MFAENGITETERIVARSTVLARSIADARIHDHSIANADGCHGWSDGIHDTGAIRPQNPPRRDPHPRNALYDPQVEMVEGGGADANADVAIVDDLRRRYIVAKPQPIQLAVSVDRQRSHHIPRRLYSANRSPLARNATDTRGRTSHFDAVHGGSPSTLIPVTGFAE